MLSPLPKIFLWLGLTAAPALAAPSWSPVVDKYRRSDLGAEGHGWAVTQLADGRLAFGLDGVVLFDGHTWRQHPLPGTYATRGLDESASGRLWIGSINEVGYFEPGRAGFTYHSLAAHLPAALRARVTEFWHAFALGGDAAVFVSNEYVLVWDGTRFHPHHLPGAGRLIAFRFRGEIHIGHLPTGVYRLRGHTLERVLSTDQLGGRGVVWMGEMADQVIVVTIEGLLVQRGNELVPFAPHLDEWIRTSVPMCATSLQAGGLALGTLRRGVLLLDATGEHTRRLQPDTVLPSDPVNALLQDREGWLWVVSPARTLRIHPSTGLSFFASPDPEVIPAYAVAGMAGTAWVATDTGVWRADRTTSGPGRLEPVLGLQERSLAFLRENGSLLVGHRRGISRIDPDGTVTLVQPFAGDVFALYRERDGGLVVGHGQDLTRIVDDVQHSLARGLADFPTSLAAPATGGLLIATGVQGVMLHGATDASSQAFAESLAQERGAAFVDEQDGTTFGVRGSTAAVLTATGRQEVALSLPHGYEARDIVAASATEAWIAGERYYGDSTHAPLLARLRIEAGQVTLQPLRLDALNRAGSLRSIAYESSPEGDQLWVGGDLGVLRVELAALQKPTPPQAPLIQLSDVTSLKADELLLPYRNNRLELEIISPEPGRRPDLRLQTLLQGGEEKWNEPRDQHTVALSNVQSGPYTLLARFVAPDGQTSPVSRFAFVVAPPWWLSPWAISFEIVAAGLGILLIVKIRVRGLRRRALELEKLVAERTAELVHASQAKTEFVASMSHELRNPLNGIVASAHALEDRGLADQQRNLVATMRHCAGLLDALVGDVLDFAEIESGRIALKTVRYDPVELVRTSVDIIQPSAQRKGIGIRLELADDLPREATGDPSRLQQVLLNLLGNAVKFSERGEVRCTVERQHPGESALLQFTVQDQGPGIPPAEQESLFEKFSRLTYAREKGIPGTGLGLAVSRQLVERMGGRIWLARNDGPGATFVFQLPVHAASKVPEVADAPAHAAIPRSALVVEDLDYNQRAMIAMLASLGCRADVVDRGSGALRRLHDHRYDVVFIDFQLPDMTGPELAREILAWYADRADAPLLVATTAYADAASRRLCEEAGIEGFIAKPVTPEKVRSALSRHDPSRLAAAPMVLPAAPAPTVPRVDLRQLKIIAPDPVALQQQARRMGEFLVADLRKVSVGARRADLEAMRHAAHHIVSHARFIGANVLAAIADEIQQADAAQLEEALNLVSALEQETERVLQELAAATRIAS